MEIKRDRDMFVINLDIKVHVLVMIADNKD